MGLLDEQVQQAVQGAQVALPGLVQAASQAVQAEVPALQQAVTPAAQDVGHAAGAGVRDGATDLSASTLLVGVGVVAAVGLVVFAAVKTGTAASRAEGALATSGGGALFAARSSAGLVWRPTMSAVAFMSELMPDAEAKYVEGLDAYFAHAPQGGEYRVEPRWDGQVYWSATYKPAHSTSWVHDVGEDGVRYESQQAAQTAAQAHADSRGRFAPGTKFTEQGTPYRDYEYVVYPSLRVEGEGTRVEDTSLGKSIDPAVRAAKAVGEGAAIYSVSKGHFVGHIQRGRYRPFR